MFRMGIGGVYGMIFKFKDIDVKLYDANNYNQNLLVMRNWKYNNKNTHCEWTDNLSIGLCLTVFLIINNSSFIP